MKLRRARAPARPALGQLRPGQGDDVDRAVRDHSSRYSTKSSSPLSAQCRSSKTSDVGAALGDPLEERAPGARTASLAAAGWRRSAETEQVREPRLHPARSSRRRRARSATAGGEQLRADASSSLALDDPGAAAHHLGQGPEADALAVRRAATAGASRRARSARRCTSAAPRAGGDLPMPRDPGDRQRGAARRSSPVGVQEVLDQAQLLVAADERRLELVPADRRHRRSRHHPERPPGGHRVGLALDGVLRRRREGDRHRSPSAYVDSPTRTVPGSAADCSRAAVLTRSPATIPWPPAPRVTAASPVRTPTRARRSAPVRAPRAPTRSTSVQRGRGRPARRRPRAPPACPTRP